MDKRGQADALAIVLIVSILVIVVVLTYVWGRGLFESQRTRSTVDYMTAKLFEIKSSILAVTHEGVNSSRIIQVDIPIGQLIITNGTFCSNNNMAGNSIAFNISAPTKLINSESWVSIDPAESNSSCYANYENNSASVLLGRAEKVGSTYTNSYTLWFRNLTQANGASNNFYLINITLGTSTKASGAGHRIVVRNTGTTNASFSIYTTVVVDII